MHAGTIRHQPEAGRRAIIDYYLRHYLTVADFDFPWCLMTAEQTKGSLNKKTAGAIRDMPGDLTGDRPIPS
jgi:hypothetical protein